MTDLFKRTPIEQAFADLRRDLITEDGPRISAMRNYRFAIVQYDPREEFAVRKQTQRLSSELSENAWHVIPIDLQRLLLERLRGLDGDFTERVIAMEKRIASADRDRGLNYLVQKLLPLIEGPDGIAKDCSRILKDHVAAHPDQVDRTLALIGRAGALYPFFRSSALLRHLDGRTENLPVVVLYPGERRGPTGLSFMGVHDPDHDYRPRIYP